MVLYHSWYGVVLQNSLCHAAVFSDGSYVMLLDHLSELTPQCHHDPWSDPKRSQTQGHQSGSNKLGFSGKSHSTLFNPNTENIDGYI